MHIILALLCAAKLLLESAEQRPADNNDVSRAIAAARARAEAGDPVAQFSLGAFLYYGSTQTAEGNEWIRKAALQRFPPAEYHLGQIHEFGFGVAPDDRLALEWYRKAADGDDLRAQYQLGQMYFDGTGLRRDYESAYVWFTLAAGQTPLEDNRKGLLELRNIAAARMTPAGVAAAKRRVAAWKPSADR